MGSSAVKSMAERIDAKVGFDPMVIVTIITTIIGLLQQCRKPASKNAAAAMIDDEFSLLLERKRADKCPLQFRRVFRENGVRDRDDQNELWAEIVADAKANRTAAAAAIVAA